MGCKKICRREFGIVLSGWVLGGGGEEYYKFEIVLLIVSDVYRGFE